MMNAVVKPYHEMCLNSSELIVPRDTYQRALHPARVARIAKEFDERVANEPKISFRDGHYYVMDGQNTIAARKFLNGGDDLQIRCKVYFNMTEQEEALLFAQQAHPAVFAGGNARERRVVAVADVFADGQFDERIDERFVFGFHIFSVFMGETNRFVRQGRTNV